MTSAFSGTPERHNVRNFPKYTITFEKMVGSEQFKKKDQINTTVAISRAF